MIFLSYIDVSYVIVKTRKNWIGVSLKEETSQQCAFKTPESITAMFFRSYYDVLTLKPLISGLKICFSSFYQCIVKIVWFNWWQLSHFYWSQFHTRTSVVLTKHIVSVLLILKRWFSVCQLPTIISWHGYS